MPTRLVIGGKNRFVSRDWPFPPGVIRPAIPRVESGTVGPTGVDMFDSDGKLVRPPVEVLKRRPGTPWTDPVEKITYRVVTQLDPAAGWVTADVVIGWYHVTYSTVLEWVQRGLLDAAMESGNPTKRYLVVDPARCRAESPGPKATRGKRRK